MAWLPPDPPDASPAAPGGAWSPPDPPDEAGSGMFISPPSSEAAKMNMAPAGMIEGLNLRGRLPSAEQAQQQSVAMGGDLNRMAGEQMDITGTHYRQLGRAVNEAYGVMPGLEPPAPADQARYEGQAMDAGLTAAGGMVGKFIGKGVVELAKKAGRGFRTPAGAERMLAGQPGQVVTGAPTATPLNELFGPALTVGGTTLVVDALDPTPYEFTDKPVAGGAGVAAGWVALREGTENLLFQNPRWRDLVMSGAGASPKATAIGGVLGYLVSQGLQLGAEQIDDVVRFVTEDEPAPAPARGAAMMGPIGGAASPMDEQSAIARQLMR